MASGSPSTEAKALTYLGVIESDRADYPRAQCLLEGAVARSRALGEPRRVSYALCALGRVALLRGDLDRAAEQLAASIDLALRHHWLAFAPWPQALLGEAQLLAGDVRAATKTTQQAFAR